MKIMSVIPAAAASSTAYWISGLSTMGSISFGLALVAGRNRVPSPATGNTAFVILRIATPFFVEFGVDRLRSCDQRPQTVLVEDGNAELLRLRKLAPGLRAGDHVMRLLRH